MSKEIIEVDQNRAVAIAPKKSIYDLINARKMNFLPVLDNNSKQFEKLLRSYINEINLKPELQACSAKSIYDGFVKCCEVNLEPCPSVGKLYLVEYRQQLSVQIGYQGWLELLWRNPMVCNVYSNIVYDGDIFEVSYGNNIVYNHVPKYESDELRLTYAVVKFKSGDIQLQVAKKKEIEQSKTASKGSTSPHSPWNKYYDAMAKIVPLRKISKNLALAIRTDDEDINHEEEKPEMPMQLNATSDMGDIRNLDIN